MTCQECQIELFDDAPGRDALVHVAECEACRALAREIRSNAEALAALRGEELTARAFVHPRRFRPWVWGLAAAAALVLGIGLPQVLEREVVPILEVTQPVQEALTEPLTPAPEITKRTQAAVRTKARPKPEQVLPVEEPAQPLLVKMLTPDPDVVIYWLIDPEKRRKNDMRKLFLILAASAAILIAQDAPTAPEAVTRMIEVKQNNVDNILRTLQPLFGGMMTITGDASRRLIIVRGPANVVNSFADTVAKLDVPAADRKAAANVEVTLHLLYGSAKADPNAKVPPDLEPTVRQLRSLFPYASYRVMDTLLLRGRDGSRGTEDSETLPGTDTFYSINFVPSVAPGPAPRTVRLQGLRLSLRMKMATGGTPEAPQFQYQPVGINTDLDAREGQKTVVGKSNVTGTEDAIILVVSPKVIE